MKKLFGLLSVVLVAVICFTQPVDAAKKEKRAKYVFYFIGDGMGINQVNGTEMYLAERAGKIGVEPLNFTTFPVRNFVTTYSAYNFGDLFGCSRYGFSYRRKDKERDDSDG